MQFKNILLLAGLIASNVYAENENIAIGVGVGSTGADVAITYPLRDNLNIRGVISGVNFDKDFNNHGLKYKGELKLFNASALVDYYPFSGNESFSRGFKISAGLTYNNTKIDVNAKADSHQIFKINGTSYSTSDVDNLKGKVKWKNNVAPYIGVGYGNPTAKKGFSVSGDLGVMYLGKTSTSLRASCAASLSSSDCDKLNSDVEAQRRKLKKYSDKADFWPVARIMLNYSF